MSTTHAAAPRTRAAKKGMAIAALVLGIVALCGSPLPILNNATIIAGIIGVVFGIIGLFGTHRVMAGIGTLLAVAGVIIGLTLQAQWAAELDQIGRQFDKDMSKVEEDLGNINEPLPPEMKMSPEDCKALTEMSNDGSTPPGC